MPKISIIMPIYNVERYIKQALESVVNQTFQDIELICIDDSSPDRSMQIVEEYAKNYPIIKIIRQEQNGGQGLARNRGLEIASGEYIMFLDPDDWLELNACEEAFNKISQTDDDMVFFDIYSYNSLGIEKSKKNSRIEALREFNTTTSFRLKDVDTQFIRTSEIFYKIYKASFLKENNIKFSADRFGEDGIFTIDAYIKANTVSVLDKPLYNYRVSRTYSVTTIANVKKFNTYLNTKNRNLESITNDENNIWLLKSFLPYYVNSALYFYNKFSKENKKYNLKFYRAIKEIFIKLNNNYDMKEYLDEKEYKVFIKIVNYNCLTIKFINFKEMLKYVFLSLQ